MHTERSIALWLYARGDRVNDLVRIGDELRRRGFAEPCVRTERAAIRYRLGPLDPTLERGMNEGMNRFVRPFPEEENKEKETRYVHVTKYVLPSV